MEKYQRLHDEDLVEDGDDQSEVQIIHPCSSLPILPTEQMALLPSASGEARSYQTIASSKSFSTTEGIHPYTRANKPKRRPFHLTPARRISAEQDSQLYARFRYYSRLRGPASHDHALVIPDHVVPPELFLFYLPGQLIDSDGKQPSYITIISIWNTMMGTSLLTMPWAFGEAGFAGGLLIMILECLICLYTACKLLTLQNTMGVQGDMYELNYLVRKLWPGSLGKAIEGTAVTFSVVTLLGALIVYWVLMSNFLFNTGVAIYQLLFGETSSIMNGTTVICPPNGTQDISPDLYNTSVPADGTLHHFWQQDLSVPIYLLVPFMFLLSIRNTAVFRFFNSFGAISVLAIYFFVVVKASGWGFHFTLTDSSSPYYIPLFKGKFMALSGTLSLAYFIHNCVITLLKGNKYPENNVRDLSIAYLLVALTYLPVGMIFYITFPFPKYCIVDNFLSNFPPHNMTLAVVRLFLLFQMLTVFPLLTYFLRSQLFAYILGPSVQHTWKQNAAVNCVVLLLSVAFAIFYPNIGFILRWVGAISGLAYIFVLPPATDMQAHYNKGTLTWCKCTISIIIMFLGLTNFTAQFFLS